jgi:hypothetical protein
MTISDNSIDLARDWYGTCLKDHDYCRKGTEAGIFFPSRILDLETGDPTIVKLLVTASAPIKEIYITLSHCWGKSQILKLETTNLQDFLKGIPLQRLPKTFRDAVQMGRNLGIRYLWIDSLCILQDSKEDWLKESAVMGKIYRYGSLNIAATAASGGDVGLSFPRDPVLSQHLRVTATWIGSSTGSDGDLPPAGDYYLVECSFWIHDVDRAPLNTRGWVLQERLLAPRILHFGSNQLYWQCGLDALCEMYPKDVGKHRLGGGPTAYTARDLRAFVQVLELIKESPTMLSDLITMEEAYQPWRTLITAYSEMNLTKGDDKLIAIQALAQTMQDAVKDRYVAGLWESRLVEDMMWRVAPGVRERARTSRPQDWRAPTWSWASVDGGTVVKAALTGRYAGHKQFDGTSLIHNLYPTVNGLGDSTTGQLRSASLKLKGCLLESIQQPLIATPVIQEQTGVMSHLSSTFESLDKSVLNIWPDEFDWSVNGHFEYVIPRKTKFLLVGRYEQTLNGTSKQYFEGLLLGLVDHSIFTRVGYFSLSCPSPEALAQLFQPAGEPKSCQQSRDHTALPMFQVTIL